MDVFDRSSFMAGHIVLFSLCLGFFLFQVPYSYAQSQQKQTYITVGSDAVSAIKAKLPNSVVLKSDKQKTLIQVNEGDQKTVSALMHEKYHRCGGFTEEKNEDQAFLLFKAPGEYVLENTLPLKIQQLATVRDLISKVESQNIYNTIERLSNYHNRFYSSRTGEMSARWIHSYWRALTQHRNDTSVSFFHHEWGQPSIVAKIQGTGSGIIAIGAHINSINSRDSGRSDHAPGADDDASGVATISEVLRVIAQSSFKPKHTLVFFGYAAEEVGLRGSDEIAQWYASSKEENVVGVVQFDMDLYNQVNDHIVFVTDFTSSNQNSFLQGLVDEYLDVGHSTTQCGYGCSDHASWTKAGIPASFPFESTFSGSNPNIHTRQDTLSSVSDSVGHAIPFAKLGIAFMIERDQQ